MLRRLRGGESDAYTELWRRHIQPALKLAGRLAPGRADDLACLIGHLSTIQRMNREQETKVRDILARWVPVFDQRVDPVELRLRAAAVVISLATGPYRGQDIDWRQQTMGMIRSAGALVRQVV